MRRISLAVFALVIAASAVSVRAQDPTIVSARQFAQQGNHDIAISMLKGALASRPSDTALKAALADVLDMKVALLSSQLSELRRELSSLRGAPSVAAVFVPRNVPAAVPGCDTSTPVRVGGHIGVPQKRADVKPVYPPIAQSSRVQGIVILEATIDCAGNVVDPRVLRGQPLLNEAALEAVSQWKYTPTLLNGSPVPVIMTMTVTFRLE